MSIVKTLTAIIALTLSANGDEFNLDPGGKPDIGVMNVRSTDLSGERCDHINYKAGRDMAWEGIHESFADTDAVVETLEIAVDTIVERVRGQTPAWVVELQEKGATYQDEKKKRAKKHMDRLSEYSQVELMIAKSMRLLPWNIDRNQLRKWAKETPR